MDNSIQKQNMTGLQQNTTEQALDEGKIRLLIEEAQHNALDIGTIKEIKEKQDEITIRFMRGEISNQEHDKLADVTENLPGEIKFGTLSEFMIALRALCFDEEKIQNMLAHENDHMVAALKYHIPVKYGILFYKTEKGLSANTFISPEIPETVPENEQKQMLQEIIGAPEELSPRDKRQLGI